MADKSAIEWTEATWNPITGCDAVSPGCDHCYAETFAERWRGTPGHPYEQGFDLTLRPERLDIPIRWTRPRRIFVNSMSDLFHNDIPDEYIARVFAVMAAAPRHTFQILTKRHGRTRSLLNLTRADDLLGEDFADTVTRSLPHPYTWDERMADPEYAERHRQRRAAGRDPYIRIRFDWPLPNVWLGVSVEDQKWADIRIPALLDTPAAVRWISAEPLLGAVDLGPFVQPGSDRRRQHRLHGHPVTGTAVSESQGLDWVVVGGESGPGARPMHPDWARSLRDQCEAADVPFLFKQRGAWAEVPGEPRSGDVWVLGDNGAVQAWKPDTAGAVAGRWGPHADVLMRRVGKKAAGRLLDGRAYDGYPEG